ncbi:MAG: hypothetical protein U9Q81_19200, partial [Pseudomonadota bacterium]|nr:hypothetical protein [Pseudomonadota bacterium]
MTKRKPPKQPRAGEPAGPAKDFSAFAELEFERLRNSEDDFDPEVFREAVELVLGKIEGNPGES